MRLPLDSILIAVALALAGSGRAAAQTTDERVWLGAGVDAGIGPKVRFEAEQELRLGVDAGFDETHTEVGAQWLPVRALRLGVLYRFAILDGETRHRVGAGGEASVRAGRLRLRYRLRGQATTRPGDDVRWVIRNRGKLELRVTRRIEPFVAVETHHMLSPVNELRELRVYAGIEWRLSKRFDLATAYLYQHEVNVGNPERNHILLVGITYHLGDLRPVEPGGITNR